MKLTDGNPTMPVKIGRRYYLLKDGDLHALPKRDAIVRMFLVGVFLFGIVAAAWLAGLR